MLPFSRGGEIIHSQPWQEAHVQALNVHQHFCLEALIFPFVRMFLCAFMCVFACRRGCFRSYSGSSLKSSTVCADVDPVN